MLVGGCYAESFTEINEMNQCSLMREYHMKPNAAMMFRWIHEKGGRCCATRQVSGLLMQKHWPFTCTTAQLSWIYTHLLQYH